jgi:hypothetical protein
VENDENVVVGEVIAYAGDACRERNERDEKAVAPRFVLSW